MNKELRKVIATTVYNGKDGHIPSAFSIVDIIAVLYEKVLKVDPQRPRWEDRDYFILSKGHGCVALYTVLRKHNFITQKDMETFCRKGGILGEHPDCTKVPGVEASTGSLGHGMPFAMGLALGLRLKNKKNRVITLVGDGECHEGTIWETANVAANLKLGNFCAVVDWNGSAAQLMSVDDLPAKWKAFGWNVQVIDGHTEDEIYKAFQNVNFQPEGQPSVIIAKTVKGKGVPMIEGHGPWHHKIPSEQEFDTIMKALS